MKNTFQFFVTKAKPFLKKQQKQMHFTGLKPKRRTFKAKAKFEGDATRCRYCLRRYRCGGCWCWRRC